MEKAVSALSKGGRGRGGGVRVSTYIARISRGKDSLKMLDVILTRDLPLDRITTSEVWATDTIPAWLPPVNEFNERVDEYIWKKYHIEVERLCARNQDGTKRTYEQGFYHIPKRRCEDKSFGKSGGGIQHPRIPRSQSSVVSRLPQTAPNLPICRGQSRASPV